MSNNRNSFEIEIIPDDSLKNLGFARVSIFKQNIVVRFLDERDPIVSKFNIEALDDRMKALEKKLINNDNVDVNSAQQLLAFLVQKILKEVEEQQVTVREFASAATTNTQKIVEEIEKDRSTIGQISSDEWAAEVKRKYQKLYEIVQQKLPYLWPSLEFELSVQKILNVKDCTMPFAGIVLDSPSSLKTVGIELFRKWHHTYYTDSYYTDSLTESIWIKCNDSRYENNNENNQNQSTLKKGTANPHHQPTRLYKSGYTSGSQNVLRETI